MHKFLFPETHGACPDASGLWVFDYTNDTTETTLYLIIALVYMHCMLCTLFFSVIMLVICVKPGLFAPMQHVL